MNLDKALKETVGQTIRKKRQKENLSLEALAHYAEMDYSYMSQVENGQRDIGLTKLFKLAGTLNLNSPGELFDGTLDDVYPKIKEEAKERRG